MVKEEWTWRFGLFSLPASSDVAGFGGRRFVVLQYEEAAKDCRGAGRPAKRIKATIQASKRPLALELASAPVLS